MLQIETLYSIQNGAKMRGFFVRNATGKALAMGATATATDAGFVMPMAKRYARDLPLCEAIARLSGVPIKWNLSVWGNRCTSGNRQELRRR